MYRISLFKIQPQLDLDGLISSNQLLLFWHVLLKGLHCGWNFPDYLMD